MGHEKIHRRHCLLLASQEQNPLQFKCSNMATSCELNVPGFGLMGIWHTLMKFGCKNKPYSSKRRGIKKQTAMANFQAKRQVVVTQIVKKI